MTDFESYISFRQQRIERFLTDELPNKDAVPRKLHNAMHYSVLGSGKKLRPLLTYIAGEMFGANISRLDLPAAGIELIHCYSLIHDDLPAMDDDDTRRGKPSCHKAYDEATALLAGNALATLAFELLNNKGDYNLALRQKLLTILGQATQEMLAGQALELELEQPTLNQQKEIDLHKTSALIQAALKLGATVAGAPAYQIATLEELGKFVGLAFQLQDNIEDQENIDKQQATTKLQHLDQQITNLLQQLTPDHAMLDNFISYIIHRRK